MKNRLRKIGAACAMFALTACVTAPNYTQYVNPFIGTGGHGHTYPGVSLPNGMVQVSPDTRLLGWDACSGYHYSDSTILGFSHTHLSGTGIGDYGDILFMPMVGDDPAVDDSVGARFSHRDEIAVPGYYSVRLPDSDIRVELTATERTALHRYIFPRTEHAIVKVDLAHSLQGHENMEMELRVISPTELAGMKRTRGWALDHPVYFYARFSQPFDARLFVDGQPVADSLVKGKALKALLDFHAAEPTQPLLVKVGISAVDIAGAEKNLSAEQPGWAFDELVARADRKWNDRLATIDVETGDLVSKRIFYTALYHAFLSPNLFSDVDGRYRGQDRQIHSLDNDSYYTVFSLWDTFRALHPLMTIVDPHLNEAFIRTLLRKYDEGGLLPKWDLASNYTGTMIGYHAVAVIAESYLKGFRNFDAQKALEACVVSSTYDPRWKNSGIPHVDKLMPEGLMYRDSLGYIPCDRENESVAKALEFAYDDWCIAQFAAAMGREDISRTYRARAAGYRNYFDPQRGFMRGRRSDGTWNTPFDPTHSNHRQDDYCEGNAWQWSWFVPHDVAGLVDLYGGREPFLCKLDSLFSISSELSGENVSSDITGLIGQYAHGNEPSHHIAHLYNCLGEGWRTQELVDRILSELYFDDPNGLAGNEDCGQMSAWYVLNAMGFYPVAPASCEYSVGRPIFDRVTIRPVDGKPIRITVHDNSRTNCYVARMQVDGEDRDHLFLSHDELRNGADIEIWMTSVKPQK